MPSGWGIYYVVFLSALLALGIPGFLSLFSAFARRKTSSKTVLGAESSIPPVTALASSRTRLARRMNARFFQGSNAALILVTCGVLLVPCVGLIHETNGDAGLLALILLLSLCAFVFLALLYASRKGDLEWLEAYREREEDES